MYLNRHNTPPIHVNTGNLKLQINVKSKYENILFDVCECVFVVIIPTDP